MSAQPHLGIIGAGAWGTALAVLANRAGSRATLLVRNAAVRTRMETQRENTTYLPKQFIDPAITITEQMAQLKPCSALVLAVPAQALRSVLMPLSDQVAAGTPILIATKGIERGSMLLMSELVQLFLTQNPLAIISGPNFADEAAAGKPTAAVISSFHRGAVEQFSFALSGTYFRLYPDDDPVGVQLCGALKNVLAIAAGITQGQGLGENARAAVITRGMAEIGRVIAAKGGKPETVMGLAGIGDMLLSCSSAKSRNYALGVVIGKAGRMKEEIAKGGKLTEGVATAESARQLAASLSVDAPIMQAVHSILSGQQPVAEAVQTLLKRPISG